MAYSVNRPGQSGDDNQAHLKRTLKKLKQFKGVTYTIRMLPGTGWVISAHQGDDELIAIGEADSVVELLGVIAIATDDDRLIAELKWHGGGLK